jgi:hypothetical protein
LRHIHDRELIDVSPSGACQLRPEPYVQHRLAAQAGEVIGVSDATVGKTTP